MDMMELLGKTGGLQSMARELGVREEEAQSGAAALLPAILGGFKKQAQPQQNSEDALGGLLGRLGGGALLDNVLSPQPTDLSRGNNVLGEIFGSKDVSRTVAENAAERSGLQPSLLKKMLPMLAMMAAGYLAKQRGGLGNLGGMGGLGGMPGSAPRRGGLGAMLDLDGNGNALDDILRMAGGRR
jgi:hypothetical protein